MKIYQKNTDQHVQSRKIPLEFIHSYRKEGHAYQMPTCIPFKMQPLIQLKFTVTISRHSQLKTTRDLLLLYRKKEEKFLQKIEYSVTRFSVFSAEIKKR
jgi:hypothetical protein